MGGAIAALRNCITALFLLRSLLHPRLLRLHPWRSSLSKVIRIMTKPTFADWAINEAVGPDKFDLLSPECIPKCNDDDTASTCSSTDSEVSDRRPVESISAVTVPKFDQVLHVCDPVNVVPATLQHLHRLTSDIKALDIGLSDY